jgi:putative flippase GtrA
MTPRSRFARYVLTGGTATALHYAVLTTMVAGGQPALAGTVLGSVAGALAGYLLTRHFVFASSSAPLPEACRFGAVSLLALPLNAALMSIGLALHLHYLLAQAITTALLLLFNFTLHRRWTFAGARA